MRPIQVGDLVQVVMWPCCNYNRGKIATVIKIDPKGLFCTNCGEAHYMPTADFSGGFKDALLCAPLSWLRRIPPLSELETQDNHESMPA